MAKDKHKGKEGKMQKKNLPLEKKGNMAIEWKEGRCLSIKLSFFAHAILVPIHSKTEGGHYNYFYDHKCGINKTLLPPFTVLWPALLYLLAKTTICHTYLHYDHKFQS